MDATSTLPSPVSALSEIGEPELGFDAIDYVQTFGLGDEHVPALVQLAQRWLDDAAFEAPSPGPAIWAPLHAWRALGQLRAPIVVPTLLAMLDPLVDREDHWCSEDFPSLCAQIGASVVEPLQTYLLDAQHAEYARVTAAQGLHLIAEYAPRERPRVCEALASALRPLLDEQPDVNAFVIVYLTELGAVEHAELMQRAFELGIVNRAMCGDWDRIAFKLGIGPEPPPRRSMLQRPADDEPRLGDEPPPARANRPKVDRAARKRQRQARKKSRRS